VLTDLMETQAMPPIFMEEGARQQHAKGTLSPLNGSGEGRGKRVGESGRGVVSPRGELQSFSTIL